MKHISVGGVGVNCPGGSVIAACLAYRKARQRGLAYCLDSKLLTLMFTFH